MRSEHVAQQESGYTGYQPLAGPLITGLKVCVLIGETFPLMTTTCSVHSHIWRYIDQRTYAHVHMCTHTLSSGDRWHRPHKRDVAATVVILYCNHPLWFCSISSVEEGQRKTDALWEHQLLLDASDSSAMELRAISWKQPLFHFEFPSLCLLLWLLALK